MILYYYSPKAYDFVCKVLLLPYPTSIRTWVASVDCEPGFFCDVIKLIWDMAYICQMLLIIDFNGHTQRDMVGSK